MTLRGNFKMIKKGNKSIESFNKILAIHQLGIRAGNI